ncbi:MAG: AAA family ATPase, partial [Anaerolineales bacterium]|nr:AAA family ATPase [Anaerolineales bacterium]
MSTFAELLGQFIHRSTYSLSQLEAFSGVPKRTVANWQGGITLKPQKWQDIVKVALALDLSDTETSSLLETARHLTLDELIANTADEDIGLLQRWVKDTTSPFQAIADLPSFVGREDEIAQITQALQQKSNIAICSFHGMGGVGKTTLAAHLAYRLRQHFSDGVLWAQLGNGNTLSILAAFARAFGEDVSGFQDIDSRSAIVRDILASKRVLIILDNATNSQEVRYLLPPTTGKPMTIVTTREDLAVTDTMERIELSPFANNGRDSLALFTFYLDGRYVKQHKQILRDIADAVGHLPLALSIIAGQLGRQPAMIEVLASTLREKTAYLDMLQREDQSVRLSFDLSYENLTPSLRRLFNALGLFHGGDFSAEAVAFILDLSTPHAEEQIEELIRLSLVQLGQAGRFRLHPLLNAYAREKVVPRALRLKAMTYFTNLAETAVSNDYSKLVPEIENIKGLLNMAHQRNDVSPFLKGVNAFSPLFLAQGLLEIQEKYLG